MYHLITVLSCSHWFQVQQCSAQLVFQPKKECHRESYAFVSVTLKRFSEYILAEGKVMLRQSVSVIRKSTHLHKYFHIFGQNCYDALKIHKKFAKAYLRLIPGKGLSITCFKNIPNSDTSTYNTRDETYKPAEEILHNVSVASDALDISPKLSKGKIKQALQEKVHKVASAVKTKQTSSFDITLEEHTEDQEESYYNEYASQYLVRSTWQLIIKYGVLPSRRITRNLQQKLSKW
ncbi:hypothetical protein PR048_012869 [Dryococelus australis]|uniref:Uncharacterized protein n=1 Tax=Dryococelus australis TaxID=614101 RepID=A0ABQ9HR00_9NEOP|nr:hypothetical protein PR048_012869 [Dryococelus australis]